MIIKPWISARDFQFLMDLHRKGFAWDGLEWGGGASSAAFAHEYNEWTVLEHDREWIEKIEESILPEDRKKFTLYKIEDTDDAYPFFPDGKLQYCDFIFVDGRRRGMCLEEILRYKAGEIIVCHDMQRNESGSLHAMRKFPYHAKVGDDCGIVLWKEPGGDLLEFLQSYNLRPVTEPSVPWHPSHEMTDHPYCGTRAVYDLI